jgi:hypothetical protein
MDGYDEGNNLVSFYDENSASEDWYSELNFRMYSKGSILTLDDMIAKEKQYIADEFNPSLVKVVSTQKQTINGIQCATITESFKYNDDTLYYVTTYVVGKNYRYELEVMMAGADYNKTSNKEIIDYIIKSLKISEPSVEDVGPIYDPSELFTTTKLYKVTDDEKKWSFEVPINWDNKNSYSDAYEYIDSNYQLAFGFQEPDKSPAELIKYYDEALKTLQSTGMYQTISKEVLNEKGATIYKYTNRLESGNRTVTEYYYIINRGGKGYIAYIDIDEMRKSAKNLKLINDIWNSITFY